jgi:hypothetical protein
MTLRSLSLGHITVEPGQQDAREDAWAMLLPFLAYEMQLTSFSDLVLGGTYTPVISVSEKEEIFGLQ